MKTGNILKICAFLAVSVFFSFIVLTFSCKMADSQSTIQENEVEESTPAPEESKSSDVYEIKKLVEDFGKVLVNVSLLSPPDILKNDMEKYYSPFVFKDLISQWLDDPMKAQGRLTSSPWPERIEIRTIENITPYSYLVKGDIIEVTSVDKETDFNLIKRPVEIIIKKNVNCWLIAEVSIGEYTDIPSVDWETSVSNNNGISFKYPEEFPAKYIYPVFWPPIIIVSAEKDTLDCPVTPAESSLPQRIISKTINSQTYCIRALSEGAAGSIYTDYYYSSILGDRIITLNLVLQYPNCTNYDDREKTECEKERQDFDLDNIIDKIIKTVQLEI